MNSRGAWIRASASAILDVHTMQRVVDPAIADLQHEPVSLTQYLAVLYLVTFCFVEGIMRVGTMRCSFCRRPDAEVSKLVAGPRRLFSGRVYICDRCAAQTIEIMEQSGGNPPRSEAATVFGRILGRFRPSRPDDGRPLRAIVTPTV